MIDIEKLVEECARAYLATEVAEIGLPEVVFAWDQCSPEHQEGCKNGVRAALAKLNEIERNADG